MADYTNLEKIRLEKAQQLRKLGIDPYPRRVKRTHFIQEAHDAFLAIEDNQEAEPILVVLTGRIRSVRSMGKISFADIEDSTGRIQLFFRADDIGEDQVSFFDNHYDLEGYKQS